MSDIPFEQPCIRMHSGLIQRLDDIVAPNSPAPNLHFVNKCLEMILTQDLVQGGGPGSKRPHVRGSQRGVCTAATLQQHPRRAVSGGKCAAPRGTWPRQSGGLGRALWPLPPVLLRTQLRGNSPGLWAGLHHSLSLTGISKSAIFC